MTFLRQIQLLLERTYAATGVNLEECLVGRHRCEELTAMAGGSARELGTEGRTFLRVADGRLFVAIYYHPRVIAALERHPPQRILCAENIRPLIVFLEELNHAVHAALRFMENRHGLDSEAFLCDLELQARVDTWLSLELIAGALRNRRRPTRRQRVWLQRCLFQTETFAYRDHRLCWRYREANRLGLRLVRHLDRLPPDCKVETIRRLRPLGFEEKRREIERLAVA